MQTNPEIFDWILAAYQANRVSFPLPEVVWSNRMTRAAGKVNYSEGNKIFLSRPLWERASPDQRRETVIHEACHLLVYRHYGYAGHHGDVWQTAMIRAGYSNPQRCHEIDRHGLVRRNSRAVAWCGCLGKEWSISSNLATRISNGHQAIEAGLVGRLYRCPNCHMPLTV